MSSLNGRILAIDHGTVRMGIAVSDELGMMAHPVGFIPAEPIEDFFTRLASVIAEKQPVLIVVGMPRNMNGTYGPAAEKVRAFVGELGKRVTIPIKLVDERLSSTQANRSLSASGVKGKKKRESVDAAAAAIILQSYLDSPMNQGL
jgi:putative Holliday junction resolvase